MSLSRIACHFCVVIITAIFSLPAAAQLQLPSFFSDNMVLQQQTNAAIWGKATANNTIKITTSWNKKTTIVKADAAGKWVTRLSTPVAGGPYTITIKAEKTLTLHNVLIGEIWLCTGQSNMEMPMKGYKDQPILGSNDAIFASANDQLRLYTIPRSVKLQPQDTSKSSAWKIATPESVSGFSATAYFFGRLLQQRLKIPVALVIISYAGSCAEAWMSATDLQSFPDISLPQPADTVKANNRTPTALYNGMLRPFIGYTIKGCIWYQGESNYERPDQYELLFPTMVKAWRKEFAQGDFPFYYAQIAPYNYAQLPPYYSGGKYNSAYLRDAQRKALTTIPNSGMIVLMDIGEEKSIHPAAKETGGKRFAYLALADTYKQKGFGYASPVYDTMKINGNTATISFKYTPNGLTSFGQPLTQFEIAGADKYFRPAQAVIKGGVVLVSSPDVKEPVAVRYAFRDFVVGELFSTEGFPVSSFRTDSW